MGNFQATHPEQLFRECSSYCEHVSTPEQMPRALEIAVRRAIYERCVSVIVIPGDVGAADCHALQQGTRLRALRSRTAEQAWARRVVGQMCSTYRHRATPQLYQQPTFGIARGRHSALGQWKWTQSPPRCLRRLRALIRAVVRVLVMRALRRANANMASLPGRMPAISRGLGPIRAIQSPG
jgi:hypothetical protein